MESQKEVVGMKAKRNNPRDPLRAFHAASLLLIALGSVFAQAASSHLKTAIETKPAAVPAVLVELFTSEGCSTCPPADKLLTDLDQNQPLEGVQVIALSEHVDYWNRLGWKDPFSSAQFSQRQADYARALSLDDFYTPQMIVDGRSQFVGSKRAAALEAIAKAAGTPKADVRLTVKTLTSNSIALTVQVENLPAVSRGDKAEVMLAITESGLMNKVSRGENAGRDLAHSSVTRKLIKIGDADGATFNAQPTVRLESLWKRQQLKVIVFVQERSSRRVLGAAAIKDAAE
jgi:hypothetical protein